MAVDVARPLRVRVALEGQDPVRLFWSFGVYGAAAVLWC